MGKEALPSQGKASAVIGCSLRENQGMNLGRKGIEEGKGHGFSDILPVLIYDCGRELSRADLIVVDTSRELANSREISSI